MNKIKKNIILVGLMLVVLSGGIFFFVQQRQQTQQQEVKKENMKKVYPLLITDKLKECADFYVKYFGFTIVFEEDWYIHLVHKSGAELAFMAPNVENQPKELHPAFAGKGMVYSFEVTDAASEYKRLSAEKDLDIVFKLKDEPWGQRHFIVEDPAGVYVDVVQQPATQ